ncbi:unnamed protein product [Dibothriocephalus latus]|uniref:Uncharacterized protein n=1 Tax=Dibothriocephalus latus TaxID=60516 RepID=A0A3P7PLA3_DIBLA|nr:unnamed protein product [Dibothriocephalus latus]
MLPVKVSSDRLLTSSATTRDAAEGPLQVTTTGLPLRCITSVRGGTEPSEEEVAEYCARMKEQRRLAQERREEEEADTAAAVADAKETDQR